MLGASGVRLAGYIQEAAEVLYVEEKPDHSNILIEQLPEDYEEIGDSFMQVSLNRRAHDKIVDRMHMVSVPYVCGCPVSWLEFVGQCAQRTRMPAFRSGGDFPLTKLSP